MTQLAKLKLPQKLKPQLKLVHSQGRSVLSSYELQRIQLRTNAEAAALVLSDILRQFDTGVPLSNQKAIRP